MPSGILFPNSYDSLVPDLGQRAPDGSIPFASRYRLVDFILSSMANCGIDNISLIVRRNYHSLMDHLGSGREWDLTRKNGGLNLVPPLCRKAVSISQRPCGSIGRYPGFPEGTKGKVCG